jgi:uncharacterized protein (TIGR02466 family)
MQQVTDAQQGISIEEVIRPFGPCIVKAKIPEQVQKDLCEAFETNLKHPDHSMNLAGNMKREFTINDSVLPGETGQRFVQMLGDGSAELYKYSKIVHWENTRRTAVEKHREIVEGRIQDMNLSCAIHQSWGNISVAGDFNPMHSHTGAISGVGYLRIPDNIHEEWEAEDHDPSVGMIQFVNGNNMQLNTNAFRLKPEVGDIYFFPAWLLHEVYPFRSSGERWSFSFNTTIQNLNHDIDLTDEDKVAIYEAREANAKS